MKKPPSAADGHLNLNLLVSLNLLSAAYHFRLKKQQLQQRRSPEGEEGLGKNLTDASTSVSTSSLKYRADSAQDFGTLECYASNSVGESKTPCLFAIVPAGE